MTQKFRPVTQKFWTAWFRFSGCNAQPTVNANVLEGIDNIVTLIVPGGKKPAFIEYQDYRQPAEQVELALPDSKGVQKKILQEVRYPFRILYPHQYIEFTLQDSFFLQDDRRTFLARYLGSELQRMADPNKLTLDGINNVRENVPYEKEQQPAVDPIPSATVSLADLQSQARLGILEGSS